VPRFGITGHMNLAPEAVPVVYQAVVDALVPYGGNDLIGVSCIARGADSIFAEAVLELGGALEVVLPAANYREAKVTPDDAAQFDELVRRAVTVRVMPFAEANREAYEAANRVVLSSCDKLFAVWDGQGAVDKGGTAAVVAEARSQGLPVEIIWPNGAARG
jgi:hypothetical protein